MKLKETLNLPKTAFPMKLDKSIEAGLRDKVVKKPDGVPSMQTFVLHDGPPFANGDIHLGHAINKVVKDITNRLKRATATFRPGWDCHGLPIENYVRENHDTINCNTPVEFRDLCAEHAGKWVKAQKEQFMRLGVSGMWDQPYTTMDKQYEGQVIRAFAEVIRHDLVYRADKPVHWSIENQTALAVAELEYETVTDKSVYVGFEQFTQWSENRGTQFLVWTTTPWTLPANVCLAINKDAEYVRVKVTLNETPKSQGGRGIVEQLYILAADRVEAVCPGAEIIQRFKGEALLGQKYVHLFEQWNGHSLVETYDFYHGDFVTTTTGTGIVHIAPSHGMDDYRLAQKHKLYYSTPVGKDGTYENAFKGLNLKGQNIFSAQDKIIEHLKSKNQLHSVVPITHEYPHDWRSKKRTIQLATPQWFIAMDKPFKIEGDDYAVSLRDRALAATEKIEFVPENGKSRFVAMLKSRPDWCISRQRSWGLPIPAYYDDNGKAYMTYESATEVGWMFDHRGSNAWYELKSYEIVADSFKRELKRDMDTFDVWFESGASWLSKPLQPEIADVYLEGSDQHRGWFQHSLLLSLAVRGKAPFKKVVTHGFVVKPDGTKVNKSDPEYVRAYEMMDKLGVDPIRLWIASNDFQKDICASPEMLEEFLPKYNKVRNTLRYLISNLGDFTPEVFEQPNPHSLDMWMLWQLRDLEKNYQDAVQSFAYHTAVAHLFNFINNTLSTVYANARKDVLYCGGKDSKERRQAQSTMHLVLVRLNAMLEPFIPYTVAEVREYYPHVGEPYVNLQGDFGMWGILFYKREEALLKLDELKKSVGLNKATDAEIVYVVPSKLWDKVVPQLQAFGRDLEDIVGCGHSEIIRNVNDENATKIEIRINDRRADYKACQRSWKRRPDVEETAGGFFLSKRDRDVLQEIARASESTDNPILFFEL